MSKRLFDNTKLAFELKNNNALRKSLFLFNIIKYPLIVRLSSFLMQLFLKFKLTITPIIKSLLFDQFCVGINEKESMMTVKKLSKFHLKSIPTIMSKVMNQRKVLMSALKILSKRSSQLQKLMMFLSQFLNQQV